MWFELKLLTTSKMKADVMKVHAILTSKPATVLLVRMASGNPLLGPHHRILWSIPLGDGTAVAAALLTLQAHAIASSMCRCQGSGI